MKRHSALPPPHEQSWACTKNRQSKRRFFESMSSPAPSSSAHTASTASPEHSTPSPYPGITTPAQAQQPTFRHFRQNALHRPPPPTARPLPQSNPNPALPTTTVADANPVGPYAQYQQYPYSFYPAAPMYPYNHPATPYMLPPSQHPHFAAYQQAPVVTQPLSASQHPTQTHTHPVHLSHIPQHAVPKAPSAIPPHLTASNPSGGESRRRYAFVNGRILDMNQAGVSIIDTGFTHGASISEVVAVVSRKAIRLEEHVLAFIKATNLIGVKLPLSLKALSDIIKQLIRVNTRNNEGRKENGRKGRGRGDRGNDNTCRYTLIMQVSLGSSTSVNSFRGISGFTNEDEVDEGSDSNDIIPTVAVWMEPVYDKGREIKFRKGIAVMDGEDIESTTDGESEVEMNGHRESLDGEIVFDDGRDDSKQDMEISKDKGMSLDSVDEEADKVPGAKEERSDRDKGKQRTNKRKYDNAMNGEGPNVLKSAGLLQKVSGIPIERLVTYAGAIPGSVSVLGHVLALRVARKKGFDDAIMFDARSGDVVSTTLGALFAVKFGVIYTPPIVGDIKCELMREFIIELARNARLVVQETPLTVPFVHSATEVFIANVQDEVCPVRKIGYKELDNVPGVVTKRVIGLVMAAIEREIGTRHDRRDLFEPMLRKRQSFSQ